MGDADRGGQGAEAALGAPPLAAARLLGDRLELMSRYAEALAGDGVVRGLIGPREAPRLWDRHLLNCAVLGELLPVGARVVDVGSGAGLPGLVLACARADLDVVLVEPLERRTTCLSEWVDTLDLAGRVSVVRGRIDDSAVRAELGPCSWMTARAVAPLAKLVDWCSPVLAPGGKLLAMKGDRAGEEVEAARSVLQRRRLTVSVEQCGAGVIEPPTTVVVVERSAA